MRKKKRKPTTNEISEWGKQCEAAAQTTQAMDSYVRKKSDAVVNAFWLRRARLLAEHTLRHGGSLVFIAPTDAEREVAFIALREFESKTDIALAK